VPGLPLSEVLDLIETRERARASGRFRAAAAVGIAVPALALAFGCFFIGSVVQVRCLRLYGGLGACDPLHPIAAVTVLGQLVILEAAIAAVLWHRRRPPPERSIAGFCLAVAMSAGWALMTSFFAAQWMSGKP
jgi:hypothetical protein